MQPGRKHGCGRALGGATGLQNVGRRERNTTNKRTGSKTTEKEGEGKDLVENREREDAAYEREH